MKITFKGQQLTLHPRKAIYWQEQDCLLLADLHLGKAAHFRKSGLAVPAEVAQTNLDNLAELLADFQPKRVIFLGDLFHSLHNNIWKVFSTFIQQYKPIKFELVRGNHDILPEAAYKSADLTVYQNPLELSPFLLSHYPQEEIPDGLYNLYGHLHPGVLLNGLGSEQHKFPCFHFGKKNGVLPAFGAFTGLAIIRPKRGDRVFVITENKILEV